MRGYKIALLVFSALLLIAVLVGSGRRIYNITCYHYRSGDVDRAIALKPDGKELVFTGDGHGGRNLYLLNLQTLHVTALTSTSDYEGDPSFSPDGRFLVYVSGKAGQRADHVFIRSLDGTVVRQLTNEDANDSCPSFWLDQSALLFTRNESYMTGGLARWGTWQDAQLCVMDTKTQAIHPLKANVSNWEGASVSSASKNGYCEIHDSGGTQIGRFVFERDAAALQIQQLTRDGASYHPTVSRDGKHIAYVSHVLGKDDDCTLSLAEANGTKPRPILQHKYMGRPVFAPGGKQLYFLSFVTSKDYEPMVDGLWQVDIDGRNLRRLADGNLFRHPLAWKAQQQDFKHGEKL